MVPDNFKVAKGIPILKKGLHTSLGNYRPISLLSIFNLILEKLIFKRFMKFIEITQNILYTKQFGHYGFRGIVKKWFCSYLNERKPFVSIGNAMSNCKQISCGVPKGSVLGPLLFLLYVMADGRVGRVLFAL